MVFTRKRKAAAQAASRRIIKRRKLVRGRTNPMTRPLRTFVQRQSVQLGRGPVPNSAFVWLRYSERIESTGALDAYVFNLNSIFDPNRTGGGHQPLGRDQYATLYNRYRVWKTRVKITAAQDSATGPTVLIVHADNQIGAYTDANNINEQIGAVSLCSEPGAMGQRFRKTYDLASITGQSKTAYKDDRFQALMSADPSENICLHLFFRHMNNNVIANGIWQCRIQLDFYVELFDPIPLAAS